MAIWHFKFYLVPASGIVRLHGADVKVLDEYRSAPGRPVFDEDAVFPNYWDNPTVLRQIALVVSGLLPEMHSWSDKARMFGDDDAHRVEVWPDDVACRVNMRDFPYELMDRLLALAKKFDCEIAIGGSGAVVEPTMAALSPHIEASDAYKFCVSPIDFLKTK